LSRTILEYANYLESKFDGDIGILERKNIQILPLLTLMGANNIDDQPLDIQQAQVFGNKLDIMNKILQFTPERAGM
jgi:hypothetical protein